MVGKIFGGKKKGHEVAREEKWGYSLTMCAYIYSCEELVFNQKSSEGTSKKKGLGPFFRLGGKEKLVQGGGWALQNASGDGGKKNRAEASISCRKGVSWREYSRGGKLTTGGEGQPELVFQT